MANKEDIPPKKSLDGEKKRSNTFYSVTMPIFTLGILLINFYMFISNNELATNNKELINQNKKLVEATTSVAEGTKKTAEATGKIALQLLEMNGLLKNPTFRIYCALKCDFPVTFDEGNCIEFKAIDYCRAIDKSQNEGIEPPRFYCVVTNWWKSPITMSMPIYYTVDQCPCPKGSAPEGELGDDSLNLKLGAAALTDLIPLNKPIETVNAMTPCNMKNSRTIRIKIAIKKINKDISTPNSKYPLANIKLVKYMTYEELVNFQKEEKERFLNIGNYQPIEM